LYRNGLEGLLLKTNQHIGPPILSSDSRPFKYRPICQFELYNDKRCPIISADRYYRSISVSKKWYRSVF